MSGAKVKLGTNRNADVDPYSTYAGVESRRGHGRKNQGITSSRRARNGTETTAGLSNLYQWVEATGLPLGKCGDLRDVIRNAYMRGMARSERRGIFDSF